VTDHDIIGDALKLYAARAIEEAGKLAQKSFRFPNGAPASAKQVSAALRLAERARQLWLNHQKNVA
jgi:hypothetical protein